MKAGEPRVSATTVEDQQASPGFLPALVRRLQRDAHLPLLGASFAVMATTVLTALIGFAFWSLAARRFTAPALGSATAAVSLAATMALVTTQGFVPALLVRLPGCDADRARRTLLAALAAIGCLSAAGAAIAVAVLPRLSDALAPLGSPLVAALLVCTATSNSLAAAVDATCIARQRGRGMTARATAHSVLKLALLAIALLFLPSSSSPAVVCGAILAAWSIPGLVSVTAAVWWLHRHDPRQPRSVSLLTELRALHGLGRHHLASLAGQAPALAMPLLIAVRLGATDAAHFNAAWMVGSACFMISPAVSTALLASVRREPRQLAARVRFSALITAGLLTVSGAILLLAGNRVLGFFGPSYAGSSRLLMIALVISSVPDGITNLAIGVFRATGRLRTVVAINGGMAAIAFIGTWVWAPSAGITAAGWAWLTAQSVGSLAIGAGVVFARVREKNRMRTTPRVACSVSPPPSTEGAAHAA